MAREQDAAGDARAGRGRRNIDGTGDGGQAAACAPTDWAGGFPGTSRDSFLLSTSPPLKILIKIA